MTDFGCSYLQGSDCYTKIHGVIPYMDPNIFKNQEFESHTYDLVEKSDIYSLGVLLWELTSCSSPFNFENLDEFEKQRISLYILEGRREIPVPGTNRKFVELYQSEYKIKSTIYIYYCNGWPWLTISTLIGCWQLELDRRPDIHQVISELNDIGSEDHNVNNFDSESNNYTSSNFNSRETEVLDDFSDCYL